MDMEKWMNYVTEKLKELLVILESFGGSLMEKIDELFPPETRKEQILHWLDVAKPYIIPSVVLLLFLCCCYRCFCCCCCGGRGSGRSLKTMKAPGRDWRILRADFESNPRSYFRDLRGKSIVDELV